MTSFTEHQSWSATIASLTTGSTITLGTEGDKVNHTLNTGTATTLTAGTSTVSVRLGTTATRTTVTYEGAVLNAANGNFVGMLVFNTATSQYYIIATTTTSLAGLTLHFDKVNASLGTNAVTFCFMAGTKIATSAGEVDVETLKAGDQILTADGATTTVVWLGRQTISMVFADAARVKPVRIKAGALADGVPARDLLLSPDHALLVDGILAQAGALVNGVSITQDGRVPANFVYYHVEAANHALILAENTPAETFIDNVERMAFDNWEEHPGGSIMVEMDLPRAKSARQIPTAIRTRLLARAEALFGSKVAAA